MSMDRIKQVGMHLVIIAVCAGALAVIAQAQGWDFGGYQALATVALSTLADAVRGVVQREKI